MLPPVPALVGEHVPPRFRTTLESVRARADYYVRTPLLVHYTDHTLRHLDLVAERFCQFIAQLPSGKQLSDHEKFVGLAACYLHDVALQQTGKAVSNDLANLTERDRNQIRKQHPIAAAEWIRNSTAAVPNTNFVYDLGLREPEECRELGELIAKLVQFHSGPLPDGFPEEVPFRGASIRLRFLLGLLRLSDALDLDGSRVPMGKTIVWTLPSDSKLHWWTHHYTESVAVTPGADIQVAMCFHPTTSGPYLRFFTDRVIGEIKREIEPNFRVFRANAFHPHVDDPRVLEPTTQKFAIPPDLKALIDQAAKPSELPLEPVRGSGYAFTKWGIVGNPWTELPASFKSQEFVVTESLLQRLDEIGNLLAGPRGDIRLFFGERGAGKTSLMYALRDRFEQKVRVVYIDVSNAIRSVSTADQLYVWVFRQIMEKLQANRDERDLDPEHFAEVLRETKAPKLLVLLDNLDLYNSDPDLKLIKRFFEISQGRFQALRERAVVVITATDEWKRALTSKDLSYIGRSSFVTLRPFTESDARQLIENRLRVVGTSYGQVFAEGVASLACHIAAGNPRKIVEVCAMVFGYADQMEGQLIDEAFVQSYYGQDLKSRSYGLAIDLAKSDADARAILTELFRCSVAIERAGISPDVAWDAVKQLFGGKKLRASELPESLRPIIARLADLKAHLIGGVLSQQEWLASKKLRKLLEEIRRRGMSPAAFIEQYRINPVAVDQKGSDSITIESLRIADEVRIHLDRAMDSFSRLEQGGFPVRLVLGARYGVEHLIVAYLTHLRAPLPPDYIDSPVDGKMVDAVGRLRNKFDWRLKKEMGDLLHQLRASKTQYLTSLPDMLLIHQKSGHIFSGHAEAITDVDARMCRDAAEKARMEIMKALSGNAGLSKPI